MKKNLLIGLLLLALPLLSQPRKYQSLLWEISGNGLAKKSYVYGSMHVSDKVSYHLSDAFFKHLLASDFVATESDPATWIPLYETMNADFNIDLYDNRLYYSKFGRKPLTRDNLLPMFRNESNLANNLLSRTTEMQKDYQEDTYLDMFIYQTGRKYKKKVLGLEDAKTSMLSVMNVENPKEEPREENVQAIVKLLRERSFNQAMLDYYREKNLDMLDSLYTMVTSPSYFKALILDRNAVMANSIDSIAKKGSLFAAVGAAHLPGKQGIIELLRQKGYTVKPIVDSYTDKGRSAKKTIDDYFIKPEFSPTATSDGMVSMPMLPKPIYSQFDIATPDLANGGIINLKRIPLRDYLRKKDAFDIKTLDSLYYENIPGTILSMKRYQEDNYSVCDITSKTKTGNSQHYRFYVTPLEIICASMSGNGNYVRRYENEIFPNIKIRKYTAGWEKIAPKKGGFTIEVPSYNTVFGDRESPSPQNIEINAYDSSEKAWYFVQEQTVNDNETLEETDFELKRIQDEFYQSVEAIQMPGSSNHSANSYESEADLGNKHLRLKTIVEGQKYYLLGTVNASAENTKKFFSSFAFEPFKTAVSTKKFEDAQGHFAVKLPEKENERYFWKTNQTDAYAADNKNLFKTSDRQYSFASPSGETADIFAWSYHRYDYVRAKDTLLANIKRTVLETYNTAISPESDLVGLDEEDYLNIDIAPTDFPVSTWDKILKPSLDKKRKENLAVISGEKLSENQYLKLTKLEFTVERPKSVQAAKYIAFIQDGYIWYVRSVIPKNSHSRSFADEIADSFEPKTTPSEYSLYDNKTALFISDAKSENDSIRYSAFESADMLRMAKEDLPTLKQFISTFEFKPEETRAVSTLLEQIGKIDDAQTIPFLESCYKKQNANSILQLAIIKALAKQKSKAAYEKIAQLFEYDLPLSDSVAEISGLFSLFAQDSEHSKVLYPDILQYYGVSEYQAPIVKFITNLIQENAVNPKKLKPYKKLLLADARLETKRLSVWKAKKGSADYSESYYATAPTDALKNYASLLYTFRKDDAVADWFSKAHSLKLPEINFELARLAIENNNEPNKKEIEELLENPAYSYKAFRLLYDQKKSDVSWSDEEIARSLALFANPGIEKSNSEFLAKREVNIGNKTAVLYFFKTVASSKNNIYSSGNTKLSTVAFLKSSDGIDPQAWKSLKPSWIQDLAKIEEEFDPIIDRLINESHLRASFGKQDDNNFFYPDSDY